MIEKFTLEEMQHIMENMNCSALDSECEICASARQKLEAMIAKEQERPVKEVRDIGGISCTIEHSQS